LAVDDRITHFKAPYGGRWEIRANVKSRSHDVSSAIWRSAAAAAAAAETYVKKASPLRRRHVFQACNKLCEKYVDVRRLFIFVCVWRGDEERCSVSFHARVNNVSSQTTCQKQLLKLYLSTDDMHAQDHCAI
jgi:hypothetical protein